MQFFPCAMFCQNSSRFLAWGNWPAMPITAMGCAAMRCAVIGCNGRDAGALEPLDAIRPRQEASFGAGALCDEGLLPDGAAAIAHGLDSAPCFSASALT